MTNTTNSNTTTTTTTTAAAPEKTPVQASSYYLCKRDLQGFF